MELFVVRAVETRLMIASNKGHDVDAVTATASHSYYRWKRLSLVCLVLAIVVFSCMAVFIMWLILSGVNQSPQPHNVPHHERVIVNIMPFLFLAPAAIGFVAMIVYSLWPCPRCGRPIHVSLAWGNPFSSRCQHCGCRIKTDRRMQRENSNGTGCVGDKPKGEENGTGRTGPKEAH
jgi:hypothetical protein